MTQYDILTQLDNMYVTVFAPQLRPVLNALRPLPGVPPPGDARGGAQDVRVRLQLLHGVRLPAGETEECRIDRLR